MNVLNILLDNWFFALIVLWLIFGLLGRGNRDKAQSEQHQLPNAERQRLERQQDILRTHTDRAEVKRKLSDVMRETARELQNRMEEMEEQWQQQEEQLQTEGPRNVDVQILDPSNKPTEIKQPYERDQKSPYERKVKQPYARRTQEPYRSPTRKRQTALVLSTDQASLKKGIIWAEVLGQPRAKRPYRPPQVRGR